jgi:glutathione peroxidase
MSGFYDIPVQSIDGTRDLLGKLRGKVTLAVNVASQCGLTPQYKGLEELQRELQDHDFTVVGFPCNQFGAQEPGTASDIGAFCQRTYGVSFSMFAKIDVNGPSTHPLYRLLKAARPGFLGLERIKWNFTKFLVDRQGRVVSRHASTLNPLQLRGAIETLLAQK